MERLSCSLEFIASNPHVHNTLLYHPTLAKSPLILYADASTLYLSEFNVQTKTVGEFVCSGNVYDYVQMPANVTVTEDGFNCVFLCGYSILQVVIDLNTYSTFVLLLCI